MQNAGKQPQASRSRDQDLLDVSVLVSDEHWAINCMLHLLSLTLPILIIGHFFVVGSFVWS